MGGGWGSGGGGGVEVGVMASEKMSASGRGAACWPGLSVMGEWGAAEVGC